VQRRYTNKYKDKIMPNGNPDFNLEEVEQFYAPLTHILNNFAKKHNLNIEKYYHDGESWDFTFQHPQKGIAQIQVMKVEDIKLMFACAWWYDEYNEASRSVIHYHSEPMEVNLNTLNELLEAELERILNWKFGDWAEVTHNSQWKKQFSKEEFETLDSKYPKLKV
jgi:hypothetical protein